MDKHVFLPMLLSAKHLVQMGFSRTLAYQLLNRDDLPVVVFGRRRFMLREGFDHWLAEQSQGGRNNDD